MISCKNCTCEKSNRLPAYIAHWWPLFSQVWKRKIKVILKLKFKIGKMEEVRTILQINIGSVKSSLQNDQDNMKMSLNNKIVAMTTRMREGIDSVKSSLVKDVEETTHMLRGEVNILIFTQWISWKYSQRNSLAIFEHKTKSFPVCNIITTLELIPGSFDDRKSVLDSKMELQINKC